MINLFLVLSSNVLFLYCMLVLLFSFIESLFTAIRWQAGGRWPDARIVNLFIYLK